MAMESERAQGLNLNLKKTLNPVQRRVSLPVDLGTAVGTAVGTCASRHQGIHLAALLRAANLAPLGGWEAPPWEAPPWEAPAWESPQSSAGEAPAWEAPQLGCVCDHRE